MKPNRSYSLRRRLVALLTLSVAAIWLLSALLVYQRAHHEADELLDAQLVQVADTLLTIVKAGEVEHFAEALQEHPRGNPVPIAFEVWGAKHHGPMRRLLTSPRYRGLDVALQPGFSEYRYDGARWRFYAVLDRDREYQVVVGQAHRARENLAAEIGASLLFPAVLGLPLMALAVWWGVGRTLRPVDRLTRQVAALDAQALTLLDASARLPDEIAPLRSALNALIRRVTEAFENERRFTADAAHELRTPLAALKVQAQVALRAHDADSQQHALTQVIAGVDRMTHLVEQLLTLARVDPARQGAALAGFDPAPHLAGLCEGYRERAALQRQTLVTELASGCRLALEPAWLEIAVRNLVDNALRYAGEGAHVEVRLTREAQGCALRVADDGPGVADTLRARLTARFTRGETDAEGCGLGLSIVERIAALSGARLEFGEGLPRQDGGHGFAALLHFGPAADRPQAAQPATGPTDQ